MSNREPYLSIVAASRNDDHGKNLLQRMQIFATGLITQCQRFQLPAELILVDWNPPANKLPLVEAISWPQQNDYCTVRVIQVSPELHAKFQHSEKMAMFQMIAKNVGIRRARGEFILATNIDLLFSDELMQFLVSRPLKSGIMYRINRYDVSENVPVNAPISEQLAFCAQNIIRINARRTTVTTPHPGPILYIPSPTEQFVSTSPHWLLQSYCWLYGSKEFLAHRFMQTRQRGWKALKISLALLRQLPNKVLHNLQASQSVTIALPRTIWMKIWNGKRFFSARRSLSHRYYGVQQRTVHAIETATYPSRYRLRQGLVSPRPYHVYKRTSQHLERATSYVQYEARISKILRVSSTSQQSSALSDKAPRQASYPVASPTHSIERSRLAPAVHRGKSVNQLIRVFLLTLAKVPLNIVGLGQRLSHLYDVAQWPHLNACGDFTLMSRQDWFRLRGYPELEIFSMHIDSMLCCAAALSGIREKILYEPYRVYHIEHGSGYTPEGWAAVVRRMDNAGIPYLTIKDFEGLIKQMRRHPARRITNNEQWGLALNQLDEKVLP